MSAEPTVAPRPSDRRIMVAWISLACLWGTTWLAIRIGLDDLPPFTFAGTRFALAAALVGALLVFRIRRRRRSGAGDTPFGAIDPTPSEWRRLLAAGVQVFAVGYGLQFWGQQFVPSGLVAIVYSTVPAVGMIFARLRVGEPVTPQRAFGLGAGIAGVSLISYGQIQGGGAMVTQGMLAFVVSVLCYGNASVTVRSLGARLDPLFITMVQMSLGAVALLGAGFALEGSISVNWTPTAMGAMAWLVIAGSALAFYLLYWLLRYLETTKVLSVLLADPLIALTLGWAWFGEALGSIETAGAVLVLGGLYLVLSAGGSGQDAAAT